MARHPGAIDEAARPTKLLLAVLKGFNLLEPWRRLPDGEQWSLMDTTNVRRVPWQLKPAEGECTTGGTAILAPPTPGIVAKEVTEAHGEESDDSQEDEFISADVRRAADATATPTGLLEHRPSHP